MDKPKTAAVPAVVAGQDFGGRGRDRKTVGRLQAVRVIRQRPHGRRGRDRPVLVGPVFRAVPEPPSRHRLRLEHGVEEQSDDASGNGLRDASQRPSSASMQNDVFDLDGESLFFCCRSNGLAEYRARGGHESSSASDRDMVVAA